MALPYDMPLISTVAVGLSLAFVCGMAVNRLHVPPIVGYLLAGIILGPYTPGMIADVRVAEEVAEIGIVLLMFGVGLHFSLHDLIEVRQIAVPGAIVQICVATGLGAGLALLWGWPLEGGLMFGLALSVASTVVLLRALEEQHLIRTNNGRIAVGWLIVEDLVMVLAIVLIPALAVLDDLQTAGSPLQKLFLAIGKIAIFIAIMLVAGRRFLPWILMVAARTRSRELFTLAVFAAAVGLAYGAAVLFGVSFALGAFFAGMMIRESALNHEVVNRILPFQDAFAVLFFVAVGMLFDPATLIEQPLGVLAVTAIIFVGKSLAAFAITLMLGYPLKTALMVSAGLAQIGEFSFILMTLGLSYGLLPPGAQDLILAGALISIALNPFAFAMSRRLYDFLEQRPRIAALFDFPRDTLSRLDPEERRSLKKFAILVGHGRVGRYVISNLDPRLELVVIDSNRERIEALRNSHFHAIAGDASHADTLREAGIGRAEAVLVAVPDSYEAQRIVTAVQEANPAVKILVRAHNDEEMAYFRDRRVDLAVSGLQEVGRRMVAFLEAEMAEDQTHEFDAGAARQA